MSAAAWGVVTARARAQRVSPSLVMVSDPGGRAAEAIRALRTHVVAQHIEAGRRALAVCAASQGAGASFIAANLAAATAQIGLKTLIVDANLRTPSLTDYLPALPGEPGLAQFLQSKTVDWSAAVAPSAIANLSAMPSGGPIANAQELLEGERFRALAELCLREFDFTVFDTPPANVCADARRVCTVVGYGLIVARRHDSYFDDLKALNSQLGADHAKVVGTVLNEG